VSSEPLKKEGAGWSQYAVRMVLQDLLSVIRENTEATIFTLLSRFISYSLTMYLSHGTAKL